MEKYTATAAAEETTDAKPELVAHVAKTLEGVSDELARDLVAGVKDADVVVLANDSASMGTAQDEWRWGETKLALERLAQRAIGGKFDSYKTAPILPAKKGGWSLRKLGRLTAKREAS